MYFCIEQTSPHFLKEGQTPPCGLKLNCSSTVQTISSEVRLCKIMLGYWSVTKVQSAED